MTRDTQFPIFPYIKYLTRPYWTQIFWGIFGVLALNLTLLAVPKVIARIVDVYTNFVPNDSMQIRHILLMSLLLFFIGLVCFGIRIFWRMLLIIIPSYNIKKNIKNEIFAHILSLSTQANSQYKVGEQISLISRETDQVSRSISWGFMLGLDGVLSVIGIYTILLISYREMAWASLVIYPLASIYVSLIFKRLSKAHRMVQEHIAAMSELTREMFQQIATIKGFNSENYYKQRFLIKGNELIKVKLNISYFQGLFFPILMVLNSIALILGIYFGIQAIQAGNASLGDFSALLSYLMQVSFPFMGLGFSLTSIMNGLASARRIKSLLDIKTTLEEKKNLHFSETTPTNIVLENVQFQYPQYEGKVEKQLQSSTPHIGPISLEIPEGMWLGITGEIGSGKTTLAKLLVRLYDATGGSISYQGNNIRDFDLNNLRESKLLQNQQFSLFSQTLAQNISFSETEVCEEDRARIIRYGTYAGLENDVKILPEQWDTQIGEDGILLSGGQKQRVSLARSIIKHTNILILDDIFSGLDYKTSNYIIKNLQDIRKDRTTILISHNLSVLSRTDKILVMDQGRIEEEGTHQSLIAKDNGLYAKSWHKYLVEEGKEFEE